MTYEEILTYFDVRSKRQDEAQCICPAHNDKEPSLTISRGDKQPVVIHCHAGCKTEAILAAAGLTMKDIMNEDSEQNQEAAEAWRTYVENREGRKIGGVNHYQDSGGNYCYSKIRLNPNTPEEQKTFRYGTFSEGFSGGKFTYGLNGKKREDIPAFFCPDYKAFQKAIVKKEYVFFCEGEKDCSTLYKKGFQALTCGGATDWNPDISEVFNGAVVIILADNDEPGQKLAATVKRDLNGIARYARIITPTPDKEHGDISDYFDEVTADGRKRTAGDFRGILQEYFHTWDDGGHLQGVYDYRVFDFLKAREDILILGAIPYLYDGGIFKPDISGSRLKSMIRDLIYQSKIKANTIKRIYDLFISAAELQARAEDFNQYPAEWICFHNGFYDPVTKQLIPHDPKYRAMNQIPHDYDPDEIQASETVKEWLSFITEESSDNLEMLLQFAGYCMTRDTRMQKFIILCGLGGTGKSLLIRMIEEVVGTENVSNISLAELTQRFASFGLLGKLVNSCADLEITALEDTSTLKKVLGEDSMRAEAKGKDAFSFKSYAKLIFSTNELPLVKAEKTNGFYRRLLILPMNRMPAKRDPGLFQKLKVEIPYFIHEAVTALGRMYEQGYITESKESADAVQQLRNDSDTVEAFLNTDCKRMPAERFREERGNLYGYYYKFCQNMERQALTRNNFYKAMRLKGFSEVSSGGDRYFTGILWIGERDPELRETLEKPLENCSKTALKTAPDLLHDGFHAVGDGESLPFENKPLPS